MGVDKRLRPATVERPDDVSGEPLGVAQGVLREVGVGLAIRPRDDRAIADRPHLRVALAAHGPIDHDVPAFVLLHR